MRRSLQAKCAGAGGAGGSQSIRLRALNTPGRGSGVSGVSSSVQVDFLSLTQGLLGWGECLGLSRNSSAVKLSLQRVTAARAPLTPSQPSVSDAAEATGAGFTLILEGQLSIRGSLTHGNPGVRDPRRREEGGGGGDAGWNTQDNDPRKGRSRLASACC